LGWRLTLPSINATGLMPWFRTSKTAGRATLPDMHFDSPHGNLLQCEYLPGLFCGLAGLCGSSLILAEQLPLPQAIYLPGPTGQKQPSSRAGVL
jgi:hypothetical protein